MAEFARAFGEKSRARVAKKRFFRYFWRFFEANSSTFLPISAIFNPAPGLIVSLRTRCVHPGPDGRIAGAVAAGVNECAFFDCGGHYSYRDYVCRSMRYRWRHGVSRRSWINAILKRLFDLTVATVALLVLCPIILIVSLAIWASLGRPILFCQQRPGLHGRPFNLYKFRTMTIATGSEGQPLPDSQRMTRLGSFLRRYSLDEFPQLVNVIRGDLSLVGPRPLLMEYLPLYSEEQFRRHDVRPGITGWAQVNGRNAVSWEERFELDVWYVDHRSLWLDMKILWMTLIKVVRAEGISQQGNVTMEKFTGRQNMDGRG